MIGPNEATSAGCFPTTEWTQIISVIQHGERQSAWPALAEFCERYRPAIRNFFRRRGCSPEQAEDFTQDFFASRILERWDSRNGFLHAAHRNEDSRFRSYLSHVLWRFLQDRWKSLNTQKAGGGIAHLPLEKLEESGCGPGVETYESFGRQFDRVFAVEVIRRATERSRHSQCLEAHLRGAISQQEAARQLGISVGAFKQSYHRFRERLAKDLWEEISKLVGPDQGEIRAEISYLMSLFAESAA